MAITYKKCPKCGSTNSVNIIYGMPIYELYQEAKRERLNWALAFLNGIAQNTSAKTVRLCDSLRIALFSKPLTSSPFIYSCRCTGL
ncbi:MAG: hypothetical protein APF81_06705 [Desulfosporosinus sp. BRH_c37]|nr:MAG: hypothetical protein APF81_06705 [Desulfosporosinus sp. BRH_c37]